MAVPKSGVILVSPGRIVNPNVHSYGLASGETILVQLYTEMSSGRAEPKYLALKCEEVPENNRTEYRNRSDDSYKFGIVYPCSPLG